MVLSSTQEERAKQGGANFVKRALRSTLDKLFQHCNFGEQSFGEKSSVLEQM